jgi:transposase
VVWVQRITIKVCSLPFSPSEGKEEKMLQRFHGMDRHKKFSTISVLNRGGEEMQFLSRCYDLRRYIEDLGPEDAVILEACSGTFW